MPPRRKVTRLVTHRLSPEQFPARAEELAVLIADNEMNLCHVAAAVKAQPRAVRRWVKVAAERGIDVLELARKVLRERGVEPGELHAEKVRQGMEDGRAKTVSDRSDTVRRPPGRPRKVKSAGTGREKDSTCNVAD